MALIFRRTKALEAKIDNYLDQVIAGSLHFKRGIAFYLQGSLNDCDQCIADLDRVESLADELRRDIEAQLYTETLIPESRGDVLGLLEAIDGVLDEANDTLGRFSIERPRIAPELGERMLDMADVTTQAVESMVAAMRSYFVDLARVRDHCAKTRFFEQECDRIAGVMMREIFASEGHDIGHKLHLRSLVKHIEQISDKAEDVCDQLSIAVIKRYD